MSHDDSLRLVQQILGARIIDQDYDGAPYEDVSDPFAPSPSQSAPSPAERRTEAPAPISEPSPAATPSPASNPTPAPGPAVINGFRDEYFFLSNFYESPTYIQYQNINILMPTGEHVFQAMKMAAMIEQDPQKRLEYVMAVSKAPTPGKAKHLGRAVNLDIPRWNGNLAIACMKRTVDLKFSQNDDLRKKLLATGDAVLVEENDWGDKIWGTVNGEGRNELGKILMAYRDHLRRH